MDKRYTVLLQAVSLAIGAWVVLRLLGRVYPFLVYPVAIVATANVVIFVMLRAYRPTLGQFYNTPGLKSYVDLVCRLCKDQPPVEHAANPERQELLLVDAEHIDDAAGRAKHVVRGQDVVIDLILRRLEETIALRRRRTSERNQQPPLASFLLVGREGVGKRLTSRVLAKLLYRNGTAYCIEADKLGTDAAAMLFGAKAAAGGLTEAVKRQPFQVIHIERVEVLDADAIEILGKVLRTGVCVDLHTKREVSFQHCLFVLTTEKGMGALTALEAKQLSEKAWHRQAVDVLSAECGIDDAFLASLGDVVSCPTPSDMVKAEVVALELQKEAATYGVTLTNVAPEIIAGEVSLIKDSTGFAFLPTRVKKILHQPLLVAAKSGRSEMALRRPRRPAERELQQTIKEI